MRKLFLDIETTPHLAYCWKLYDETIGLSQVVKPTRMLSVAYAFDDEAMQFTAEWGRGGRPRMVKRIHKALDQADAVIHYNGAHFDERHLNREFLQQRLDPPSPYATIDIYRTIKQRFRFASARLEQVARELEVREGKLKTDFSLWRRVMDGDKEARAQMEVYNKEDVELLRELYPELLPWISRHPNAALFEGDTLMRCTRCAGTDLIRNGMAYTSAGVFQKYRCRTCGGNNRGAKREATTPLREAQ